jgi:hypothetical protein
MMMTERGVVAPAVGGSVLAQFDDILAAAAPELAGHVQAVAFDADTGRLDVAPAYSTKLRWSAPKLVAAANEKCRARTSARCTSWRPHPDAVGAQGLGDRLEVGSAAGGAVAAAAGGQTVGGAVAAVWVYPNPKRLDRIPPGSCSCKTGIPEDFGTARRWGGCSQTSEQSLVSAPLEDCRFGSRAVVDVRGPLCG